MAAAPLSVVLFVLVFFLVETGKVGRHQAMLAGAILMLMLGWIFDFYALHQALKSIYFDTLALIFGMSLVGNILIRSGLFNVLAMKVTAYSRGNAQLVLVLLVLITYGFSLVVNNLGTMLIILPLTLALCNEARLEPVPIVIAELIASNLGGASTLIGDFPNMIIGAAGKLHFDDFIGGMMVPCLMMLAILLGYFGKRMAQSSHDGGIMMEKQIFEQKGINNYLLRVGITILSVMLLAMLFAYPLGLRPGTIALVAGVVILIFGRVPHEFFFKAISGADIFFFASLFIMVGGLQSAGVLTIFHELIVTWGGNNITQSLLLFMLLSALLTPFLNAGPATALLIPVAEVINRDFPGSQVWWALSLGVLVGSSATLSGATAGPVVANQMLHQLKDHQRMSHSGWILDSRKYRQWGIPIAGSFLLFSMFYIAMWIQ
ncbi:Magnetosome protein MamN [Gammaproteobacteria bacterium]